MSNIEEYKKRFYNLMESTIGDAKPLVSEQFDNDENKEWEELVGDESELGSEENELEEDKIEDFADEDDEENSDDIDLTYESIEGEINNALSHLSPEEGKELLERISELVEGLKSNDEDSDEEDEDDSMDLWMA